MPCRSRWPTAASPCSCNWAWCWAKTSPTSNRPTCCRIPLPGRPGPQPAQPQPAAGGKIHRRRREGPRAGTHPPHRQPGKRLLRGMAERALPIHAGTPALAHARPAHQLTPNRKRGGRPAPRGTDSMTTLITHPLPVLALGLALGSRAIGPRLLLAGMLAACYPTSMCWPSSWALPTTTPSVIEASAIPCCSRRAWVCLGRCAAACWAAAR